MARLLQCIFVGCEEHISGLEAIYKSSLPELQHALKEAELAMHRARSLCSEAPCRLDSYEFVVVLSIFRAARPWSTSEL